VSLRGGEPPFDADRRAELVRRIYSQRNYPEEALDAGVEGEVMVRFRLDDKGLPLDIDVTQPSVGNDSLVREAVRMVAAGAPYPVPSMRRTIELFTAAAYRNTPGGRPDTVVVVLPSGNAPIDGHVTLLATEDAANDEREGWQLVSFAVRAVFDVPPGGPAEASLVSFEGDPRWRRFLLEHAGDLLPSGSSTGFLRLPIKFRIVDL